MNSVEEAAAVENDLRIENTAEEDLNRRVMAAIGGGGDKGLDVGGGGAPRREWEGGRVKFESEAKEEKEKGRCVVL